MCPSAGVSVDCGSSEIENQGLPSHALRRGSCAVWEWGYGGEHKQQVSRHVFILALDLVRVPRVLPCLPHNNRLDSGFGSQINKPLSPLGGFHPITAAEVKLYQPV